MVSAANALVRPVVRVEVEFVTGGMRGVSLADPLVVAGKLFLACGVPWPLHAFQRCIVGTAVLSQPELPSLQCVLRRMAVQTKWVLLALDFADVYPAVYVSLLPPSLQ
jgi:hypothetical protein